MPHFEIHADDVTAAKGFYGGLFGWTFVDMDAGDGTEYVLASGDGVGMEHALTVGLMKRADGPGRASGPIRGGTMVFDVADCDESYAWALAHGGAEALPPQDYPGIGRCAYVDDGQGNVVGFITPTPEA
ncbi:MAG: VOC family protein [Pseudomonadota bacterium]